MPTIVEQIQRDALDPSIPVSSLLRRVKVAAVKLKLESVEDWVAQELNGYKNNVPSYRVISGIPSALNPQRGMIPLQGDAQSIANISKMPCLQSISSIEHLAFTEGNDLFFKYGAALQARLSRGSEIDWPYYALVTDRTAMIAIIDAVRNLVLDWAIDLERAGISGSEFSFTNQEQIKAKETAMTLHIGKIGTMIGNVGTGNTTGDISVGEINARQAIDLSKQIREFVPALVAAGIEEGELVQRLDIIDAEANKQKPSQGLLRAALTDVRNMVSGASGNIAASGILELLKPILGG